MRGYDYMTPDQLYELFVDKSTTPDELRRLGKRIVVRQLQELDPALSSDEAGIIADKLLSIGRE